jgi:hypothetical protein
MEFGSIVWMGLYYYKIMKTNNDYYYYHVLMMLMMYAIMHVYLFYIPCSTLIMMMTCSVSWLLSLLWFGFILFNSLL